jgi:hypothetical protein
MAKKTTSRQQQTKRMRRGDPERGTADRRATHHIMLMAKKPNGKKTSPGPDPGVSGSVQDAISSMVRKSSAFIEEQILAGQNAAARMRHGMTQTGQLNANINMLAESLVAVTRDIGVTWIELLSMIVRSLDAQAPLPGGPGGGGIPHPPPRRGGTVTHTSKSGGAATLSSITAADAEIPVVPPHIVVKGKKAKSVALDLRPSSTRFVPHIRHLVATDPKHSLTAKFTRSSDPLRLVLVVEVPDSQHPGTYTGAVVDSSTNEPGGTVSVTVAK